MDVTTGWPKPGQISENGLRCDYSGCVYQFADYLISFPKTALALQEDCQLADMVISGKIPIQRAYCMKPDLVIDRDALKGLGGHLITLKKGQKPIIETVEDTRGKRLWTNSDYGS